MHEEQLLTKSGTAYIDQGHGTPLLLVHGSGPGVSASANWSQTIGRLATEHRVLAPDLIGWGSTDIPNDVRYGTQTWVDQLALFLNELKIDSIAIIGNSLGGLISLHMALQHPTRITRLVLMGSGFPDDNWTPTEALRSVRDYEPSLENMRRLLLDNFVSDPSFVTEDLVQQRYEASIASGAREAYRAMNTVTDSTGNDAPGRVFDLPEIKVPCLILHGWEDKVASVEGALALMERIPDCELHFFSNCGHWVQVEQARRFERLALGFLNPDK